MGQILSQPVTDKTGEDGNLYYGVSSMQGWRVTMEDAHATVLDLRAKGADAPATAKDAVAFFAVYDGHGGDRTALVAGERVHELVAATPSFKSGDYAAALRNGFLATDAELLKEPHALDSSGCAATSVLITKNKIVCGNAGDSRTVLGTRGTAKPLSFDHKPDNEGERARIIAAGGFVDMGRVNGNLALSRAIGDFTFKKSPKLPAEQQVVTVLPDIVEHDLLDDDEFVVLACDGIWDCMNSQVVVEFVRRCIADGIELQEICELLMQECLAPESEMSGIGCDNMTVCIVALLRDRTKQEWYDWIKARVEEGNGPVCNRTVAQIREGIEQRLKSSHGHDDRVSGGYHDVEEEDDNSPSACLRPQAVLQQLFSGAESGKLNAEATALLSKLGIRLVQPDSSEEHNDENEGDDSHALDVSQRSASHGEPFSSADDDTPQVEYDEGEAVAQDEATPRDDWH